MPTLIHVIVLLLISLVASQAPAADADPAPAHLFARHCASCHGADRLGQMGPALLPESLARLKPAAARQVIANGRAATQMPAFGAVLAPAQIDALTAWIYQDTGEVPPWGEAAIRASRIVHADVAALPARPLFEADPMNVFLVVEQGDHHVSVLDGDKMERIHRFASRYALHGGPKFTADGRFVYFASRDGWITKYDLWNLTPVVEVRAGVNTRNLAVSSDGKVVAVANYLPHTLVLLDGELNLLKVLAVTDASGQSGSRVSAVYDAAPRRSFVAALKDVPELWEISYDPLAEPIAAGYIHDYQYREGSFQPGYLNPRRTPLEDVLDDFFFTQDYAAVMGTARKTRQGQVVNLDVRRKVAELAIGGMPHLGSGITWQWHGRTVMASPNLKEGKISIIDMADWQVLKEVAMPGPGFFMRSHENSRYAWIDSMMSPTGRDTLQILDKERFEIVGQVREPGKTLAHVEFDRDGRYVIASLMEDQGAIIFYDATTWKELKRLPASKPIGKYNVFNKTRRSEGTSH
jgi:DNA-binding beta-propeller fold protein YncE/cytochrome c553